MCNLSSEQVEHLLRQKTALIRQLEARIAELEEQLLAEDAMVDRRLVTPMAGKKPHAHKEEAPNAAA